MLDSDYVFANESGNPRWPESMLTDHVKPAAAKAGVGKCRLADIQAHVLALASRPWHKATRPKGTAAPCQYSNNAECLHSGYFRGKEEGGF
jgi:hypothetical protein